jgi:hypothetical protein
MPLRRHLKSFLDRRDYEQDEKEVIASVESSCVRVIKRKLNFFWKAKNIQFERSRAPSPDSMIVKYSKEVSTDN